MRPTFALCALLLIGHSAHAQPQDAAPSPPEASCEHAIAAAERRIGLPPKLLQTIGIVESGRIDPATGRVAPWPWTINVAGVGHAYATKADAIAAVRDLQAHGVTSIDIGCVQINLMHHPEAFASLDDAFDPALNTLYGAHFLSALYRQTGNWPQAAAAYHSRTLDIGASYETRVMSIWPLAAKFPDATLHVRTHTTELDADLAMYTPEFAARLKQQRADMARLTANARLNPAAFRRMAYRR